MENAAKKLNIRSMKESSELFTNEAEASAKPVLRFSETVSLKPELCPVFIEVLNRDIPEFIDRVAREAKIPEATKSPPDIVAQN